MSINGEAPHRSERTLAGVGLFRDLAADVVKMLSERCRWRRYRAHQPIVNYQDETRDAFFVVHGKVRAMCFSISGREVSFRDVGVGEMFGELSAIDGQPRSADVVALTDALLAAMAASDFWDALRRHESIAALTLRHLANLVRATTERVVELSTLPVPRRIQAEVLRIARRHAPDGQTAVIFPAPTHSEIASRISTNREAVTRELGELRRAGLIQRRGGALVVPNINLLASHLSGSLGQDTRLTFAMGAGKG